MLLVRDVEPETGAEVFERMVQGYWVNPVDQRKQLQSALDELRWDSDTLSEQIGAIMREPVQGFLFPRDQYLIAAPA